MIIYPKQISKEKYIGVTAISSGVTDEIKLIKLDNAYKNLEKIGYTKFLETENVRKAEGHVSSSTKVRVEEFMKLWKDDKVDHIIPPTGGEFLMETLCEFEKLDLSTNIPKWVQGFSDISLLLFYLTTKYNIATVHSSSFTSYGMNPMYISLHKTLEILENKNLSIQKNYEMYQNTYDRVEKNSLAPYKLTKKVKYENLRENEKEPINFSGRIIGGCIDVLRISARN